jgi:hypothetical protein
MNDRARDGAINVGRQAQSRERSDRVALNELDLAVQLWSHSTDRVDKLQLFNRRIK